MAIFALSENTLVTIESVYKLGDSSNSRSTESTLKDRDLTSRAVLFVTCLTDMKTLEDHGDDTFTREHNVQHDPPKLVEVIKVMTGDFNNPVSFHEDDLPKGALQKLIRIEFLSTMSFMCLRRDRIGSLKVKNFRQEDLTHKSMVNYKRVYEKAMASRKGLCTDINSRNWERELPPIIGVIRIDLLGLYKFVDAMGGYMNVTFNDKWYQVANILGLANEHHETVKEVYKEYIGMVKVYYEEAKRSRHGEPRDVAESCRGTAEKERPQVDAKINAEVEEMPAEDIQGNGSQDVRKIVNMDWMPTMEAILKAYKSQ
ncbi:ARID DNA-binding domain-containing protein [Tanacetum coccineum]